MTQVQLSSIPFPEKTKDVTKGDLASSQLLDYTKQREEDFKNFSTLLGRSLQNSLKFNYEQEQSLALLQQQDKAKTFIDKFIPETFDEEMDFYAKKAGFDSRGKIYFGKDDQIHTGFMGHSAASDAGNMFNGNFELISSNQASIRNKTQMMGSNALLSKSKAWPSIQKRFELMGSDKEDYLQQLQTDTNWSRLTNINSFESLARAVPIIDPLFTMISGTTPEEQYLTRKDPSFDGNAIVDDIIKNDPEFTAFLTSQGVNLNDLRQSENPFHFRWILNSTVQANAMSRSLQSAELYHSAPVNWALFGYDQLYGSLTSGDFVGQIGITVATAGLGAVASGIATTVNGLTASSRVAGAIKASETAVNMARAGQLVKGIQNWIPANIPQTLIHTFAHDGIKMGTSKGGKVLSWIAGQSIEGFVEEGITDIANQIYEKEKVGSRLSYDYGQMWQAAWMGAAMEPILGGAITGISIPVNITASFAGKFGSQIGENLFTGIFNVDSARVGEFKLYLDEFLGKFDHLSPEEQQVRIGIITSALATEAALNEVTNGKFGKVEEKHNQELIAKLMSILGEDHRLAKNDEGRLLLSEIALKLAKIKEDLTGPSGKGTVRIETIQEGLTTDEVGRGHIGFKEQPSQKFLVFQSGPDLRNVTKIPYTEAMSKIFSVEDGNLSFTREGTELMMIALIVDNQSSSETIGDNVTEMILFLARQKLSDKIKKDNPKFQKKELSEEEQEELEDKITKVIAEEGEDFTNIVDQINSMFEVIKQLDLNPKDDVESTVDIKIDPEIAKKLARSRQETRNRFNKQEEAATGMPPLLSRPTEEEMAPSKPWSMMDEVTPVETTTAVSEVAATTPEIAPEVAKTPEVAPETPEVDTTIKELANIIPKEFTLPAGYKAESNGLQDDGSIFYNIINTENNLSEGQIYFVWDSKNKLLRPTPPTGVNLYPQAQKKGLYAAWLTEINKYVDLASSGIDRESGTMPDAVKVWIKLGAKIESTEEVEAISGNQAYVLRKTVTTTSETAKAPEVVSKTTATPETTKVTIEARTGELKNKLSPEMLHFVKNLTKCS
jgi:hypothetical protein